MNHGASWWVAGHIVLARACATSGVVMAHDADVRPSDSGTMPDE
jgi:hypothetical protein